MNSPKSVNAELAVVSAYSPASEGQPAPATENAPADVQWQLGPVGNAEAVLTQVEQQAMGNGVTVHKVPIGGDPAEAILRTAEELGADLIVVGNRGMTGMSRFLLGAVPNKISHHAPCSVLIVRTT